MLTLVALVALSISLPSCRRGQSSNGTQYTYNAQLDSALKAVNDVDSLAALARQARESGDAVAQMFALKYQSRALRELSRSDEAIVVYNEYLAIATKLADTVEMVNALHGLGTVYRRLSHLSKANDNMFQALKLSDSYSDQESERALRVRAKVLGSIGDVEIELFNLTFADSVLRLALATSERLDDNLGLTINYRNLGLIKQYCGQNDSARIYYDKSLECAQLDNNNKAVALCHLHFGDLHVNERRFSHAIEEYKFAYNELKNQNDSWNWMDAGLALAKVYILLGEVDEAHRYLEEADSEACRFGSKEFQAEACMLHYELSLMKGNTQEALKYYIRGNELQDSIHGLVPAGDDMLNPHIDYERGRTSGEMNVLNRDIDKLKHSNKVRLMLSILLLLMAAAVIGALAYAIRVRMRTQQLMRQVEETRSLFFTNVVHQLRSPLTAIMGSMDNLLAEGRSHPEDFSEEQIRDARVIERQGKNLLMLVDRILEVGGVRSAIKDPEWRRGDAVTFVKMIIERYQDKCSARHIEIAYAPQESSVDIVTVPRYLSTIVGNLLENAVNYCSDYGKIRVTTGVKNGLFTLCVADDGMGISQNDLPHVFEPFYRGAAAEQLVDGIGIGLTVVRDMAMAMGGTVDVDSVKNQGAVFTVELPCKRDSVKERFEPMVETLRDMPWRKQHQDAGPNEQEKRADKPVALVVEDQNDIAQLVGHVLSELCDVHYATDGELGLAKAWDLQPDVIITDVKMPLMNGLDMCRILRKNDKLCHIPVIMLSARTSDEDRIRGIEAGADVYLLKPFVRDELLAWVKRLLERKSMSQTDKEEGEASDMTNTAAPSVDDKAADEEFLATFAQELDKEFGSGNKLVLDKVALRFKMGEIQLRRKIQALTGMNVPAYITKLRMEKAMRLMRECPDCLIGDIADQCGYQDVAYFSRVFRQYYGMTPTQARHQ